MDSIIISVNGNARRVLMYCPEKTTEEPNDEKESLTADIVVVGSGIAGMSGGRSISCTKWSFSRI